MVQDVCPPAHPLRPARDGQAIISAVLVLAGLRCPLRIQIDIVCNKQVEVAVTVVVYKTATGVPPSRWTVLLKAGLLRNIGERPVSVVVVKDDSTPISHDQIVISVVVIISDAAPLAPSRSKQSSFLRYVRKGPIAVIVKQKVRRLMLRRDALKSRPIHHKDVQPAIVVVIEKGNTTSRFLQEPALVGATAENIDCSA